MATFYEVLEECCKNGGTCTCKEGGKCDSPSCKCKAAGKGKGKKVVKESKFDSDEAGDAKYHAKKDDAGDKKGACANCGSTKGFVAGKCLACGDKKGVVKESKFEQYLQEAEAETLMEGTMDAELRKKIIALGIPVPSTVSVDAVNNIKKQLTAKGHQDTASEVDGAMKYSPVELKNKQQFKA